MRLEQTPLAGRAHWMGFIRLSLIKTLAVDRISPMEAITGYAPTDSDTLPGRCLALRETRPAGRGFIGWIHPLCLLSKCWQSIEDFSKWKHTLRLCTYR